MSVIHGTRFYGLWSMCVWEENAGFSMYTLYLERIIWFRGFLVVVCYVIAYGDVFLVVLSFVSMVAF